MTLTNQPECKQRPGNLVQSSTGIDVKARPIVNQPALFMKGCSEGVESSENAWWRGLEPGLERAQACLTARRARGRSTPGVFAAIGDSSRQFMISAG